ncbi:MAG: hypothetical protein IJZ74_06560 [Clostridia bacterium]|nr:hypothetical protein [Clostridia bacterium]
MKLMTVMRESLKLYRKNWTDLLLALLLELVLRAMCLTPVVFLASPSLAALAWLCVPMYIFIALPARQNYALALQDMMDGGRVFSLRLVSTKDYGRKLLRGLIGTGKMLLWSALSIAGVSAMLAIYNGVVDGFSALRLFSQLGGGSTTDGVMMAVGAIAATCILPVIGCAVHSGVRHAEALGNRKLVKSRHGALAALWVLGLALLIPFAAVLLITMGNWALAFIAQIKTSLLTGLVIEPLGARAYVLAAAVLVLLLPVLPLKNMLPAVYLRGVKENKSNDAA